MKTTATTTTTETYLFLLRHKGKSCVYWQRTKEFYALSILWLKSLPGSLLLACVYVLWIRCVNNHLQIHINMIVIQ